MQQQQPPLASDSIRAAIQPGGGPRLGTSLQRPTDARTTLARLVPYFARYKGLLGLVLLCVVVYVVMGLFGPYLMAVALDRFIATRDLAGLGRLALLMLATFFLNNLFQTAANWLMAGLSQRALERMRGDLFRHLQRLPLAFFDRRPAGELMSRLTTDVDAINQAAAQNVTALLASMLSMVGIVVAMFVLDRWLALVSLLVVPLMLWFTSFVATYTRRGFQRLQAALGDLNGVMEESLGGQRVVKAFRRNESVVAAFRERNEEVYRAGVAANTYALLLMPLTAVLGNLFVIMLAGLGGWLALRGLVSVGLIAAFINYGQNFVQPLRQLSNLYNTIQGALAGAERVFDLIDTPAETDDVTEARALPSVRGNVRFDHVRFGYRPDAPIIRDMSLEARAGDLIALVGPTGAGKTTIINLLPRFYDVIGGAVQILPTLIVNRGKNIEGRLQELYTPLELAGRDIYISEGCYNCHSQMIRILESDVMRYGRAGVADDYSHFGESIFDHPFQWGSKRTGPDLAHE
ncbi:MAG: ABC transporter transmembrane domain-containing protein, partial [Deltaproteobacteria bacterium]